MTDAVLRQELIFERTARQLAEARLADCERRFCDVMMALSRTIDAVVDDDGPDLRKVRG